MSLVHHSIMLIYSPITLAVILTHKWWNWAYDQITITTKEVLSQGGVKILETSSIQMANAVCPQTPESVLLRYLMMVFSGMNTKFLLWRKFSSFAFFCPFETSLQTKLRHLISEQTGQLSKIKAVTLYLHEPDFLFFFSYFESTQNAC